MPNESHEFFVDNIAEPFFGAQIGPGVLKNTHSPEKCAGRPCVIHSPSEHHMRSWPMNWRSDIGVMERMCPHGIGHPDPDDVAYHISIGQKWAASHGCDGCCIAPN